LIERLIYFDAKDLRFSELARKTYRETRKSRFITGLKPALFAGPLEQARTDALAALQRLDPIMANVLRNDPTTLAVWESARHVERYGVSKPAEKKDEQKVEAEKVEEKPPVTQPPIPPQTTNVAEAAQA
jgi:hypothetical protein